MSAWRSCINVASARNYPREGKILKLEPASFQLDDKERFKTALISCFKAMSEDAEATIAFTQGQTRLIGSRLYIREPEALTPNAKSAYRAEIDSYALRLLHYRLRDDLAYRPAAPRALPHYIGFHYARCEILGAYHYLGVRRNLYARYARLWRGAFDIPLVRFAQISELEAQALLYAFAFPDFPCPETAPRLARLQASAPAGVARAYAELLDNLQDSIAFSRCAARLANLLIGADQEETGALDETGAAPTADSLAPENDPYAEGAQNLQEGDDFQEQSQDHSPPETDDSERAVSEAENEDSDTGGEGTGTGTGAGECLDFGADEFDDFDPNAKDKTGFEYKVFTTEFDREVRADKICKPGEREELKLRFQKICQQQKVTTARIAAKLQRRIAGVRLSQKIDDVSEGELDPEKLSAVIISPLKGEIYMQQKQAPLRDTAVTLLIDNSGSMRGRPVAVAALSASVLSDILERCGVKTEILGFTTGDWRGGAVKKKWVNAGSPPAPGRLNEIRHYIYKSADESFKSGRDNISVMLKEGILKENIDGEALLWAANRLLRRRESRKILIVISDGAPVDDATMSVNENAYLEKHLRLVIAKLEKTKGLELIAVGIGHDVTKWYQKAVTVKDPDRLGAVLSEEFVRLFK